MGNGNIDVGKNAATRKPGEPVERSAAGNPAAGPRIDKPVPPKKERVRICGAMSQQRGDSGHESAPQEFVHLVGYRDPKARPDPWIRPTRPAPLKR